MFVYKCAVEDVDEGTGGNVGIALASDENAWIVMIEFVFR